MATGIKHVIAGPFHMRVMGQIPEPKIIRHRGARENTTPPAQAFYNDKRSWMELRLLIYANFGAKAYVLTFTYADQFLPPDKKSAQRGPMAKLNRRMRDYKKRRSQEWQYIYTTEGYHGISSSEFFAADEYLEDKRIHHHMIANLDGPEDFDVIRSQWEDIGGGYVRIEPFEIRYGTALAKYMTKEAREFGRAKPGDRTWCRSMNLTPYVVEYSEIGMNGITLAPERGAVDYETFHLKNPYGFADLIGDCYLLFESPPEPEYFYARGPQKKKPPFI